jgi:hypothetical protein
MNTDRLTTILGLFAGSTSAIANSGLLPPQYSQPLNMASGILVGALGYFSNKPSLQFKTRL